MALHSIHRFEMQFAWSQSLSDMHWTHLPSGLHIPISQASFSLHGTHLLLLQTGAFLFLHCVELRHSTHSPVDVSHVRPLQFFTLLGPWHKPSPELSGVQSAFCTSWVPPPDWHPVDNPKRSMHKAKFSRLILFCRCPLFITTSMKYVDESALCAYNPYSY